MCQCIGICTCVWADTREGVGSPGAGATGDCELPSVGAVTKLPSTLEHLTTEPPFQPCYLF